MATFTNIQSIAAFKAANGNQPINFGPSPKEGIFLFSCGSKSGYVSKAAYGEKDPAKLQYTDVVADDGTVYPMITLAGNSGGPITVAYSL